VTRALASFLSYFFNCKVSSEHKSPEHQPQVTRVKVTKSPGHKLSVIKLEDIEESFKVLVSLKVGVVKRRLKR